LEKDISADDFLRFAVETARKAALKALPLYGKGDPSVNFDEAVVTEAELAVRGFFDSEVASRYPNHTIGDERFLVERGYSHGEGRYLWIMDPLDGSANFQAGIPVWGISIALLENFWPVLGVFYMPSTNDMFCARAGGKAFRGEATMSVSDRDIITDESLLFTYSRFNQHYKTSFPGKIRTMGCAGAHICYVAMGRAEAAILANQSFYELAAPYVILQAAGGRLYTTDGREFFPGEYSEGGRISEHLLAAPPGTVSQLKGHLTRI
jgi:myo-inositol-1(or 4)-monophosphatase